jgi:diguanylate cyclase (GGDEF)-like protein
MKDTDTPARILIVDDDPSTVLLLAQLLEPAGVVHVTTRGSQALDLAAAIRPDVILLDFEMPDADGIEVCRQIKAHADLADTLVLFVTSHEDVPLEARALTAGAIDVIHKPVNPDIVRARVKNYLSLKRQGDRLRRLSTVDGLTGVSNRRAFDTALELEWSRSDRTGDPLALMICDIDHFKGYNDAVGHVGGDGCLQRVARELARHARRAADLVARYGGEEFVLLLPDCATADARAIGEGVLHGVSSLRIAHPTSATSPHVTVSIGLAWRQPAHRDPQDFIQAADEALYRAKRAGRNRLEVAGIDGGDGWSAPRATARATVSRA